jgi:PIN domain nuclease of toxin-antitoxin system
VAPLTYLDTHVAAWLYAGHVELLSARARQLLNKEDLLISPMVALELEYLHAIGRLTVGGNTVIQSLHVQIGLLMCDLPFANVIESALKQDWTRDPFDRIIVGQAAIRGSGLLTKDATIRKQYRHARW